MSRLGRSRRERGSLALELTIIAPIMLMLFFLFMAFGRFGQVSGLVEQAARDSARTATQARSEPAMTGAIQSVRDQAAAQLPDSCGDTLEPSVRFEGASGVEAFVRGAFITVTYTCTVSYSDLMLPGLSDHEITKSFTSRLDPNRGVY
ncbi:MAG: hypothetical protein GEU93_07400 [Propionibacteriales bacterium]|nr:hypothetical protein [Propionibacteriales bacterium]